MIKFNTVDTSGGDPAICHCYLVLFILVWLATRDDSSSTISELMLPSGGWLRLTFPSGRSCWCAWSQTSGSWIRVFPLSNVLCVSHFASLPSEITWLIVYKMAVKDKIPFRELWVQGVYRSLMLQHVCNVIVTAVSSLLQRAICYRVYVSSMLQNTIYEFHVTVCL